MICRADYREHDRLGVAPRVAESARERDGQQPATEQPYGHRLRCVYLHLLALGV